MMMTTVMIFKVVTRDAMTILFKHFPWTRTFFLCDLQFPSEAQTRHPDASATAKCKKSKQLDTWC